MIAPSDRDCPATIAAVALPHIAAIEPYVPGKPIADVVRELGFDASRIVKLASNENALGSSPAAQKSLRASAADSSRYPDNDCIDLRAGLARHLGLELEQIIIGAGSSELILLAAHALLEPCRSVVLPKYSFVSYEGAARAVGANAIIVPTRGWQPDLDRMLESIDRTVRLVFIASPNNPTGVLVEPAVLERFISAVPQDVLVVLDEAYHDFVAPQLRVNAPDLIRRHSNLLVLRTFSKIYGLAALRVGFGIADAAVIALLRKLQPPFSVNAPAQAAALAALGDEEFVARSASMNDQGRKVLYAEFTRGGFEHIPANGNFVLVRVGDGVQVFRDLLRYGVVIRPVSNYGLEEWIRVTVGLPQENSTFLTALRELLPNGTPR